MDEFEKLQRKQEARRRLAAQRSRAGRLRGRVVAGSLVCFALLWGVVFGQMVTGNDPVLAPKAEKAAAKVARVRAAAPPTETIETTEPDEVEAQVATPTPVEAEAPVEAEPPAEVEPEPEPLTTGQS